MEFSTALSKPKKENRVTLDAVVVQLGDPRSVATSSEGIQN